MSEGAPKARRVRVVQLATVHPPFDVRVFDKHCRSLARAGYEVTYITAHDRTEQRDGVTVVGIPKARTRVERLTRVLPAVIRAAFRANGDVYHFHDVELILAGYLLKLAGKKVIYDVHENYPADVFLEKPYLPVWIRHVLSGSVAAAEWLAGRWFDAVVTATGVIGARFPAATTAVVRNYARVAELQQGVAGPPYAAREPIALFTGGLTPIRCATEMCAINDALRDLPGFRTVVVGRPNTPQYPDELKALPGWDLMRYEGIVPMARVRELLGEARVALCLNQPRADFLDLATNKLFEYMAVGLPVVSTDIPFWRQLIEEAGCGIVVTGADAGELAAAVRQLLEHPAEAEAMGARGRAAAEQRYNWASEERVLLGVYERVVG
ncbi:MAG: glycosyltransferase [Gemmatimonadetes bacterium]|nr:glycosyltransferase [Gemmatimonadota bacterium]